MEVMQLKVTGIIAAGGSGTRLGAAGGKQLLEVAGRPIAAWSLDALAQAELIDEIIVVCDPDRVEEYAQSIGDAATTDKPLSFVAGGETRKQSVMAGLIAAKPGIVAIHDGARPLLEAAYVDKAVQRLIDSDVDGVVVGIPVVDTLKRVSVDSTSDCVRVSNSPDRSSYWQAQTPQIFWREQLICAYQRADALDYKGTDDASYVEQRGGKVVLAQGSRSNIKITRPEDVDLIEAVLEKAVNK